MCLKNERTSEQKWRRKNENKTRCQMQIFSSLFLSIFASKSDSYFFKWNLTRTVEQIRLFCHYNGIPFFVSPFIAKRIKEKTEGEHFLRFSPPLKAIYGADIPHWHFINQIYIPKLTLFFSAAKYTLFPFPSCSMKLFEIIFFASNDRTDIFFCLPVGIIVLCIFPRWHCR